MQVRVAVLSYGFCRMYVIGVHKTKASVLPLPSPSKKKKKIPKRVSNPLGLPKRCPKLRLSFLCILNIYRSMQSLFHLIFHWKWKKKKEEEKDGKIYKDYLLFLGGKEVCLELSCPVITKQWEFLFPRITCGAKMRQAGLCNTNSIQRWLLTSSQPLRTD